MIAIPSIILLLSTLAGDAEHRAYDGAVELPGTRLEFDIDLSTDGTTWSGDISIPAQGAQDLPLEQIAVDGARISFRIAGVPGAPTFVGTLSQDGATCDGEFSQGGATFPFHMATREVATAATQELLAGFLDEAERARAALRVPGCAIVIVKGDDVLLADGVGQREIGAGLPVTAQTLFAIGSSSKAFTTFVMGTLVDEGRLDFDRPVRTWLPQLRLADPVLSERITPRDLVTHRSGLPRHDLLWYANSKLRREEILERLPHLALSKDLRTAFQYNNLMYATAGILIEHITGMSWEQAVRERIFAPLGMTRSRFEIDDDARRDDDYARPYELRRDATSAQGSKDGAPGPRVATEVPFHVFPAVGPAGSILSCADDLGHWLRMLLAGGSHDGRQLLATPTLIDLATPVVAMGSDPRGETRPVGYAMGWFIDEHRGHRRVQHGGNIDGFSALVCLLPGDGIGIAVLTNLGGTPLPDLIVNLALDRLLPDGPPHGDRIAELSGKLAQAEAEGAKAKTRAHAERREGTTPSHPQAEYPGTYSHPGYGDIVITDVDGRLVAHYGDATMPLAHHHFDVFTSTGATPPEFDDTKLRFDSEFDGEIDAVLVQIEASTAAARFVRAPDAELRDDALLDRLAGRYSLRGVTLTVARRGDALTLTVPGQPTYVLEPQQRLTYALKDLAGYRARFVREGDAITGLDLLQPDGVHRASRSDAAGAADDAGDA